MISWYHIETFSEKKEMNDLWPKALLIKYFCGAWPWGEYTSKVNFIKTQFINNILIFLLDFLQKSWAENANIPKSFEDLKSPLEW